MITKDWCALAMAASGFGCVCLFYIMVAAARCDVYYGDRRRTIRLMQWGTIVMQLFMAAVGCWISCFI